MLLAALRSEAALDDLKGHWSAWNERTNDITGDIAVSSDRITFKNGVTVQLAYVGTRSDLFSNIGFDGRRGLEGRLFRIVNPVRSILLNGNTLCGLYTPDVATYLVIYQLKNRHLLLDAYKGSHQPNARADGQCLSMEYIRPD